MTGMRTNLRVGMDIPNKKPKPAPKFLLRVRITDTGATGQQNYIVPIGGFFCMARGIGTGGYYTGSLSDYDNISAGGGEYVYDGFATIAGETLITKVSASTNNGPFATEVFRGPKLLLHAAAGGNVFTNGVPGIGGTSTNHPRSAVVTAGTAGTVTQGGSQVGDVSQNDSLNIFGVGANGNPSTATSAQGFGGGANKTAGLVRRHTGGILVLEFYTSDPRGVII